MGRKGAREHTMQRLLMLVEKEPTDVGRRMHARGEEGEGELQMPESSDEEFINVTYASKIDASMTT